jgi:hypothetical protein
MPDKSSFLMLIHLPPSGRPDINALFYHYESNHNANRGDMYNGKK